MSCDVVVFLQEVKIKQYITKIYIVKIGYVKTKSPPKWQVLMSDDKEK